MAWYMLVPNATLNIVIWIAIGFFIAIIGVIIYFLQEWLRSDTIIKVNKDNTIDIVNRIISKEERIAGKIKSGKHDYLLEPKGVMNTKRFPQWKKIYVFDEGISLPRKIEYRKDMWFGTETVQKILNDTRIKQMTKEPIDPNLKLFLVLGACAGILACLASIVNLMINLGIIGGK